MDPLRRAEDSQEVSAGDKVRSRNKHGLVRRFLVLQDLAGFSLKILSALDVFRQKCPSPSKVFK